MGKSIRVITKKRRGRPVTTGKGTLIGVRLLEEPMAALDAWITAQKESDLTRPEAIRRLVEIGLSAPSSRKRAKVLSTSSESAARAAELAAKVIDKRLVAAPAAERATRKRKLVEGPSIVRGIRKDQS